MIKEDIKDRLEEYLRNKGKDTRKNFKCLVCGGGDDTPPMSYKDNIVKCFSCGFTGDVYDLIGAEYGLTEFNDQLEKAKEIFNIYEFKEEKKQPVQKEHNTPNAQQTPKDYLAYIEQCHQRVQETDYFIKRGLTAAAINKFKLGYDPGKKAIIIPVTKYYYISRSVEGKHYYNLKNTPSQLFNKRYLNNHNKRPIFITEGSIDALSIEEVGGQAIALNGTGNISKLIKGLENIKDKPMLLLSLDNDEPGQKATETLIEELKNLNIVYLKANISGKHKDPNEALVADKDIFKAIVHEAEEQITREATAEQEATKEEYLQTSTKYHINKFMKGIADSVNTPAIETKFSNLDRELDGGLFEGLYIIGAISSLGKTTFILQIADQIAQQGHDVLIFSLEMARTELMAKSISRLTLLNTDNARYAKTTRGITEGKRHLKYSKEEKDLINKSILSYNEYAENIYISEELGNIGVMEIREAVRKHIEITGKTPILIVDYIQILSPLDPRASDKQNTDVAVLELKRISRDHKTTVLGISSLNRSNYNTEINMAAFKESGAIEYSSDVLLGLQYEGQGKDFDIEEAANENPRKIELKILKNRNGGRGKVAFDYYPLFNYFKESTNGSNNNHQGTQQRRRY